MLIKKLTAALLVSVLALSAIGCGAGNTKNDASSTKNAENVTKISAENPWEATVKGDGSWDRVKKEGKITAGLDDSYPPMGFHDDSGKLVGFDIDMAKLISEKIGVEIEFVPADWSAIVPSLQTNKFDLIISGMNMWDSRIEQVNYIPYGIASQVILVKKDEVKPEMKDVSYFDDKVLGTQLNSTAAEYLNAAGYEEGKNLKLYQTFPEITVDLDNGRIKGLAIDSFGAVDLLKTGKYEEVAQIKSSKGKASDMIGIAVKKEDGDLQAKIAQAVDELLVEGKLKEVSMKWIGTDITEPLVADAQKRLDNNK